MKSKKMTEIDNLVVDWQTTKDQEKGKELYEKFKYYFKTYAKTDEEMSTAQLAFVRAINTFDINTKVYFVTWFKRIWLQHRMEMISYATKKKRTGKKIIPIDAEYGHEEGMLISEMIKDEKIEKEQKRIENEKRFLEFLKRDDITDREREILKNIYFETGRFQTEIAQQMGISQACVHKTIRAIHKKPYADDLKKLMIEMMEND